MSSLCTYIAILRDKNTGTEIETTHFAYENEDAVRAFLARHMKSNYQIVSINPKRKIK